MDETQKAPPTYVIARDYRTARDVIREMEGEEQRHIPFRYVGETGHDLRGRGQGARLVVVDEWWAGKRPATVDLLNLEMRFAMMRGFEMVRRAY